MMNKKLGIVTVLYNSNNVLQGFFESLAKQQFSNYYLYIIDNSVSEESTSIINTLLSKYNLTTKAVHIKSDGNVGIAKGNNVGISMALKDECEFVLLANNDVEFYDTEILNKMQAQCAIANIVSPKLYYFDDKEIVWYAGGHVSKITGLAPHYGRNKKDEPQYCVQKFVQYGPTCFMMFKKEIFKIVGLMDENYFVYFDDSDFLIRCNKAGYKILLLPQLKVYHKIANSSGGSQSSFYVELMARNRFYFILKNFTGIYKFSAFMFGVAITVYRFITLNATKRKSLIKGTKAGIKLVKENLL